MSQRTSNGPIPVLFVIGSLEIGGAEKQLVEIAVGLDRSRFAPVVCSLAAGGPLATVLGRHGIPVVSAGFEGVSRVGVARALVAVPTSLWRFFGMLRRARPVVLHAMLFHAYVLGAIAATLAQVPVVVTSRRSLAHFKKGRLHYRALELITNRLTDCIVANSEAVRQDTLASEGLRPDDVLVIHNGIEAGRYHGERDTGVREQLGAEGDSPVAVVLANLIHYKGHRYFFEAWSAVLRSHPRAVAWLVGDGPLRSAFEAELGARGLSSSVRVLGTRTDVPRLLASADVLVHPSLEEGFSNALLEGMAAGLPVVATDVGGNPEAVLDGKTGYLVPARDAAALAHAIGQVFSRPDLGRSMGEAGRRRVMQEFQLGTMIRRYEDLYLRLLGERH
ncbi:MAG: glycosyltransferase [Acidobacteria bacterium]|nr:glycosyltransferase [Acidobacteriota bacterium]